MSQEEMLCFVAHEPTEDGWAQIYGYAYEVSRLGRVRSMLRFVERPCRWGGTSIHLYKGKELKTWLAGRGYKMVSLGAGNENKKYVHRLVAEAFCEKTDGATEINHKDGNIRNNRANNLEWVTPSEKMCHATHVLGNRGGMFGPNRTRYPAGAKA